MDGPTRAPVLLVEDDADLREALMDLFEVHEVPAERAGSASEAIRRLGQEPHPCAVLLDLVLPDVSGERVIEWIRAQPPPLNRVPVIVFTGTHWTPVGADTVLRKPVDGEQLVAVVIGLAERCVL